MYDSWTCLSVEKGPGVISDDVRSALKVAACELAHQKWDEIRVENDLISGIIQTEWKSHLVGTRAGILFRSQIDCEDGTDYQINFLLSMEDLKRGVDIIREMEERGNGEWRASKERFPVPELYQFHNLRGPSRRVH